MVEFRNDGTFTLLDTVQYVEETAMYMGSSKGARILLLLSSSSS